MSYLLSIIVPTKNRYTYLQTIIETFRDMDSGEVELVIQDNSDNNEEILNILENNDSSNIKYYYYKEHMPVSENFSKGVSNSTGKYVCMLGDDDNVSLKVVEIVKYMDENHIDSAIFNKAKYHWPDLKFRAHKIPSLIIPKCTGKIININVQDELRKCLRKGTTSLMKLPEIYQGIVKRTTLDKIFNTCNTYFPGASPDMAIAVALSLVVESHIYVNAPYTLSGQAYNSAGGRGARHSHNGRLKDISWLPNDIEDKWESRIPMIWTGDTIYAESAHKALKAMGREDLIKEFNYSYQYAHFICFNPKYKSYLNPLIKNNFIMKVKISLNLVQIFSLRVLIFIKNLLATKMGISKDKIYKDVENSYEASKLVGNFIEVQNTNDNIKK